MKELRRDSRALADNEFDLLVIGGGIVGAGCARDAALRGLSTALIEKADFGGATSAGCFKIVHGGLRYLQHFNLARLRESVREQQIARIIAPHLVHPLPFLIPTYGWGKRGRPALKLAMELYERLVPWRNDGVGESSRLAKHQLLSAEECLQIAPGIDSRGLTGGAVYYDCNMSSAERFTFSVVAAAVEAGASVCNHLEATGFSLVEDPRGVRIGSVQVKDRLSGESFDIRARQIINATGPWNPLLAEFIAPRSPDTLQFYSKGIQIITPQLTGDYAVAVESRYRDPAARISRGGRSFFFQPWRGRTLIGTTDTVWQGAPEDFSISAEDIQQFLADLQGAYVDATLNSSNVEYAFGGLRPVQNSVLERINSGEKIPVGEATAAMKDIVIDHSVKHDISNLISVQGVKYTTFRALAERIVDAVSVKLNRETAPRRTKHTPLYGGDMEDFGAFLAGTLKSNERLSKEALTHLVRHYGTCTNDILKLIEQEPSLGEPILAGNETLAAELVYVSRREMVGRLSDAVFGRTGLGTLGYPGKEALTRAAALAGAELGWSEERQVEEVSLVDEHYRRMGSFFRGN